MRPVVAKLIKKRKNKLLIAPGLGKHQKFSDADGARGFERTFNTHRMTYRNGRQINYNAG